MTPREWHETAIRRARSALFEYQVANQAMFDARRALECAGDEIGAGRIDMILHMAARDVPQSLQMAVNDLERDPVLDVAKDIMSAGEVSADE